MRPSQVSAFVWFVWFVDKQDSACGALRARQRTCYRRRENPIRIVRGAA
jgi:hypothetical protein